MFKSAIKALSLHFQKLSNPFSQNSPNESSLVFLIRVSRHLHIKSWTRGMFFMLQLHKLLIGQTMGTCSETISARRHRHRNSPSERSTPWEAAHLHVLLLCHVLSPHTVTHTSEKERHLPRLFTVPPPAPFLSFLPLLLLLMPVMDVIWRAPLEHSSVNNSSAL